MIDAARRSRVKCAGRKWEVGREREREKRSENEQVGARERESDEEVGRI